jgi:hypothetical protein
MLDPELVKNLFCEYLDNKIDILITVAKKLHTGNLRASYEYCNEMMSMDENIDELVSGTAEYVNIF